MDGQTACDKCGLRAVRYELERQGIMLRFCDTCYWGALEVEEVPVDMRLVKKEQVNPPAPKGG